PPSTHFTARLVRRAASPRTAVDPFHRSARPPSGPTSHCRRPISPLGSSAERPHLALPSTHFTARLVRRAASPRTAVDPFHRSARPPSGLTPHRRRPVSPLGSSAGRPHRRPPSGRAAGRGGLDHGVRVAGVR